jgi:hypothetical protein
MYSSVHAFIRTGVTFNFKDHNGKDRRNWAVNLVPYMDNITYDSVKIMLLNLSV